MEVPPAPVLSVNSSSFTCISCYVFVCMYILFATVTHHLMTSIFLRHQKSKSCIIVLITWLVDLFTINVIKKDYLTSNNQQNCFIFYYYFTITLPGASYIDCNQSYIHMITFSLSLVEQPTLKKFSTKKYHIYKVVTPSM